MTTESTQTPPVTVPAVPPAAVPAVRPAAARRFRIIAVAEACSWAGLLAGMLVKYAGSGDERGVHLFGPLHGLLFVLYLVLGLLAARGYRWRRWVTALALAASVPPFGSAVFERWATWTGRLPR